MYKALLELSLKRTGFLELTQLKAAVVKRVFCFNDLVSKVFGATVGTLRCCGLNPSEALFKRDELR